ncbi:MAG: hypothetical protein DMF61_05860 [Blastocatellia bacterium AA13]|nr:MAG: hypothetical protein DMF61_05860 [Blastocatellia bacterium AA13]
MPEIYSAFASEVKVNQETIEGLQSIEYVMVKNRQSVGAIGSDERIAVYFGLKSVNGKLRVASGNKTLDDLLQKDTEFSISATLKHRDTTRKVTFDSCYIEDKSFGMASQGYGETIYSFTATRVREE